MSAEVIAFPQRRPAYAPGVPPFDPSNPAHVQAWNAMCEVGRDWLRAEQERQS